MKNDTTVVKPFGAEFLEELPTVTYDPSGKNSPGSISTLTCSGTHTGGGDDPQKESVCDVE